jgi:hypothetical protein
MTVSSAAWPAREKRGSAWCERRQPKHVRYTCERFVEELAQRCRRHDSAMDAGFELHRLDANQQLAAGARDRTAAERPALEGSWVHPAVCWGRAHPARKCPRAHGRPVACGLQQVRVMSVKTMLPILGVGSAALAIGIAAARRSRSASSSSSLRGAPLPRDRPSGIQTKGSFAEDVEDGIPVGPVELTSEFWDAAPESDSRLDEALRPTSRPEPYDAIDIEDLTTQWLSRATQAPLSDDSDAFEIDDPAEIPADSLSMISQASRDAAAYADDAGERDDEDDDAPYER